MARATTTDRKGYVYVITNPAWPGLVKIGRAVSVTKRIEEFNTGDPFRAYGVWCQIPFEDAYSAESSMHGLFSTLCVGGEWFRVRPEVAEKSLIDLRYAELNIKAERGSNESPIGGYGDGRFSRERQPPLGAGVEGAGRQV